jgi:predicted nucleic acid-binding protein
LRIVVARVFLDANVFLYAVGGDSPHRASCRAVVEAVGKGTIDGITSTEVLQEILHVRSRRSGVKDATNAARAAAEIVADVLPVTKPDILVACDILDIHPRPAARDALHVAVMRNARIRLLVSLDKDFDAFADIKRVSPTEALRTAG